MPSASSILWRSLLIIPTCWLISRSTSWGCGDEGPTNAESAEDWTRAEQAIEILETGDESARTEVASSASSAFEVLLYPNSDRAREARILEDLRRLAHLEKVDWIATRLLEDLREIGDDGIFSDLFLDALQNGSPNRRWQAIRWFGAHEDIRALPTLESAWLTESRPWIRMDLIKALARNRSSRCFEDFVDLAGSEDPYLSSAAIGALMLIRDPRAIRGLTELTSGGTLWQQREAADALSLYPDSSQALTALLDASESENSDVRACATRALVKMGSLVGLCRAVAVSLMDTSMDVRSMSIEAINLSPYYQIVDGTLRSLPERLPEDRPILEKELSRALEPWLSHFSGSGSSMRPARKTHERDPRCRFYSRGGLDPGNPESMRASPPEGMNSVRCFKYPEVAGDPGILSRISRGSLLFISDHFETARESWVQVHGFVTPRPCWLPESQVVKASEERPPEEEEGILRRDFDLQVDELRSPAFVEMTQAGMVEIIEPGGELVAVTLRVHMDDTNEVALLRQATSSMESLLFRNVFWMLEDGYERICDYPSMVEFAVEIGTSVHYCLGLPPGVTDPEAEPESSDSPPVNR